MRIMYGNNIIEGDDDIIETGLDLFKELVSMKVTVLVKIESEEYSICQLENNKYEKDFIKLLKSLNIKYIKCNSNFIQYKVFF